MVAGVHRDVHDAGAPAGALRLVGGAAPLEDLGGVRGLHDVLGHHAGAEAVGPRQPLAQPVDRPARVLREPLVDDGAEPAFVLAVEELLDDGLDSGHRDGKRGRGLVGAGGVDLGAHDRDWLRVGVPAQEQRPGAAPHERRVREVDVAVLRGARLEKPDGRLLEQGDRHHAVARGVRDEPHHADEVLDRVRKRRAVGHELGQEHVAVVRALRLERYGVAERGERGDHGGVRPELPGEHLGIRVEQAGPGCVDRRRRPAPAAGQPVLHHGERGLEPVGGGAELRRGTSGPPRELRGDGLRRERAGALTDLAHHVLHGAVGGAAGHEPHRSRGGGRAYQLGELAPRVVVPYLGEVREERGGPGARGGGIAFGPEERGDVSPDGPPLGVLGDVARRVGDAGRQHVEHVVEHVLADPRGRVRLGARVQQPVEVVDGLGEVGAPGGLLLRGNALREHRGGEAGEGAEVLDERLEVPAGGGRHLRHYGEHPPDDGGLRDDLDVAGIVVLEPVLGQRLVVDVLLPQPLVVPVVPLVEVVGVPDLVQVLLAGPGDYPAHHGKASVDVVPGAGHVGQHLADVGKRPGLVGSQLLDVPVVDLGGPGPVGVGLVRLGRGVERDVEVPGAGALGVVQVVPLFRILPGVLLRALFGPLFGGLPGILFSGLGRIAPEPRGHGRDLVHRHRVVPGLLGDGRAGDFQLRKRLVRRRGDRLLHRADGSGRRLARGLRLPRDLLAAPAPLRVAERHPRRLAGVLGELLVVGVARLRDALAEVLGAVRGEHRVEERKPASAAGHAGLEPAAAEDEVGGGAERDKRLGPAHLGGDLLELPGEVAERGHELALGDLRPVEAEGLDELAEGRDGRTAAPVLHAAHECVGEGVPPVPVLVGLGVGDLALDDGLDRLEHPAYLGLEHVADIRTPGGDMVGDERGEHGRAVALRGGVVDGDVDVPRLPAQRVDAQREPVAQTCIGRAELVAEPGVAPASHPTGVDEVLGNGVVPKGAPVLLPRLA